jgi:hypothetical protein
MQTASQNNSPATSSLDHTIRGWNDVLALWRLCRKGSCVRACACRGRDAERCFHAHFGLLPDSVIEWFYSLADAQKQGLTYDQALEGMRDTIAENALEEWRVAIAQSAAFLRSAARARRQAAQPPFVSAPASS